MSRLSKLMGDTKNETQKVQTEEPQEKTETQRAETNPRSRLDNAIAKVKENAPNVPMPDEMADIDYASVIPEELSVDQEVEQFKRDLATLDKIVEADAPELREGILSVMKRMQEKSHLSEYLYNTEEAMKTAIRAFRRQFTKRHKSVVVHRKKKAKANAEVDDFMAGLD